VFTARYGLSPYIPQIRFVFKRLILRDSDPLQVHVGSYLYSVPSVHTNIYLDHCDAKRSGLDKAREMCGVCWCSTFPLWARMV
jgi:hypothetical protein